MPYFQAYITLLFLCSLHFPVLAFSADPSELWYRIVPFQAGHQSFSQSHNGRRRVRVHGRSEIIAFIVEVNGFIAHYRCIISAFLSLRWH